MFENGMRVALIHIRYVYKGGLETRLFNYIDYFLQRGDEVHLFTSKKADDIDVPEGLKVHFINLRRVPKPIRNFFFDKKLKKILDRNSFDFILSLERTSRQNHVIAPSTHKGYLDAKGNRLYDLVDLMQLYLDRKAFKNAQVIYACSEMVKNEIIRYYHISPNNVKVLYPPINLSRFNQKLDKQAMRAKWRFEPDDKLFLLVSTSHKRKGLDILQKVFAHLPQNYKLLVAGSSFDSALENVISLGFVKNVQEIYAAADMLLHPAVYEPFGQIITEAFAAHLPVYVSNRVGAKELVNKQRGKVIPSLDPADWLAAIQSIEWSTFSFEDIDGLLEELALPEHMARMLNWAKLKK
jgi:glycosyltransferase involved in cell wall biosynthesis